MTINVYVGIGVVEGPVREVDVDPRNAPGVRFTIAVQGGETIMPTCREAVLDVLAFGRRAEWALAVLKSGAHVCVKGRLLSLGERVVVQSDWLECLRGGR